MIGILIVNDHYLVREGLAKIIQQESDLKIVGQASDPIQAISIMTTHQVDVVILDTALPGMNSFELIKKLIKLQSSSKILMLNIYQENKLTISALKSGASGYLSKDAAPQNIIDAIRIVHSGKSYITPALAEKLLDELRTPSDEVPHEKLSSREFEVMRMIGSGNSLNEIAEHLAISNRTVYTYRTRVLDKLNIKNNAMIMKYCLNYGLIE